MSNQIRKKFNKHILKSVNLTHVIDLLIQNTQTEYKMQKHKIYQRKLKIDVHKTHNIFTFTFNHGSNMDTNWNSRKWLW